MNEIARKCLYLTREEKIRLINLLNESMDESEINDKRFEILYKAATDVVGQGIKTKIKDYPLVVGRKMIAYQMRQEGYSLQAIGKQLVRHHASIIHLEKSMKEVLQYPHVFKLEMAWWQEFQKKVKEYEVN